MYWVGTAGDGAWSNPGNWDIFEAPQVYDYLYVQNPGALPLMSGNVVIDDEGMVRFSNLINASVNNVTVGQSTGNAFLSVFDGATVGMDSLTTSASSGVALVFFSIVDASVTVAGQSDIGHAGYTDMTIDEAGVLQDSGAILGSTATGNLEAVLSGSGTAWHTGNMIISDAGRVVLDVRNGARITATDVTMGQGLNPQVPLVTIDGADPAGNPARLEATGNVLIGDSNGAEVTIDNGGLLSVSGACTIGNGTIFTSVEVGGQHAPSTPSTLSTPNAPISVGTAADATLLVNRGGFVESVGGTISLLSTSDSNVTVTGIGSQWDAKTGALVVGDMGPGNLRIADGGEVLSGQGVVGLNTNDADATVTGHGSQWISSASPLVVGGFSAQDNDLTIEEGGYVESQGASIGDLDTAHYNTATVTGASPVDLTPSTWDARGGDFIVGAGGDSNRLQVLAGGYLHTDNAIVGRDSTAQFNDATVRGAGSLWDVNGGTLIIGKNGMGSVDVKDGGAVQNVLAVTLGHVAGSYGNLLVGGAGQAGTLDITAQLTVGHSGAGTVSLHDNGHIDSERGYLGGTSTGGGTVAVDGANAEWNITQDLEVGQDGTGILQVTQGAVTVGDELHIGNAGSSIAVGGGTLTFGRFGNPWLGTMTFAAGKVHVTHDDVVLGLNEPMSFLSDLNDGMTLQVDQTFRVSTARAINVNHGGQLIVNNAQNDGGVYVFEGGLAQVDGNFQNAKSVDLYGGTIGGSGTFTNGFSGKFYGYGTLDLFFVNYGQATIVDNTDANADTANYGLFKMGDNVEFSAYPYGPQVSYRTHGVFSNFGQVVLGNAIDGSGSVINAPSGVIETGACAIHGISVPVSNYGLIYAMTQYTSSDSVYVITRTPTESQPYPTMLVLSDLSGGNQSGGELRVDDTCTINVLCDLSNNGLINLLGPDASFLGSGDLANQGVIQGQGRVNQDIDNLGLIAVPTGGTLNLSGVIDNRLDGVIEVGEGAALLISDSMPTNYGGIVIDNAAMTLSGPALSNESTGYISGSGTLTVGHLNNAGHIGVGPDHDMELHGGLTNNGTVNVADACRLTIYGPVDGSGSFNGPAGTTVVLGNMHPGNSPGSLTFGGDLVLGGSMLYMELSGDAPTSEYDQLIVVGNITISGQLEVVLYDGWTPSAGDVYDLLQFGSLTGTFNDVILPELPIGLSWDTSALYLDGDIGVVPEPGSLAVLALGGAMLICRRSKAERPSSSGPDRAVRKNAADAEPAAVPQSGKALDHGNGCV
jgi:T5SS/PEP-CTERM-associated repeat protein